MAPLGIKLEQLLYNSIWKIVLYAYQKKMKNPAIKVILILNSSEVGQSCSQNHPGDLGLELESKIRFS